MRSSLQLTDIPMELFTFFVAKNFSSPAIKNLRLTCRFFGHSHQLKELQEKNGLKIEARGNQTFFCYRDRIYAIGSRSSNALGFIKKEFLGEPTLVLLPAGKWAVKIFLGPNKIIILDNEGSYYHSKGFLEEDNYLQPLYLPDNQKIIEIVVGEYQFFIRSHLNNWYAYGANSCGQLGIGRKENVDKLSLLSLSNGDLIEEIASGWAATALRDNKGQWYVCGSSLDLGLDLDFNSTSPIPISLFNKKTIKKIELGFQTTFILNEDGEWVASGKNIFHELGFISNENFVKMLSVHLPNKKRIVKILPGTNHTFLCDEEGEWYGSGYCRDGCLGLGKEIANKWQVTPTRISLPTGKQIIEIAAGERHTFFADEDGNWYGCGSNSYGQLFLSKEVETQFDIIPIDFERFKACILELDEKKCQSPPLRL